MLGKLRHEKKDPEVSKYTNTLVEDVSNAVQASIYKINFIQVAAWSLPENRKF